MDLDTFLTQLYVLIDDWYKEHPEYHWAGERGPQSRLSDSEVITLAVAGQWRVGVPWQSERGLVRWAQQEGRALFPAMVGRSTFNERVRQMWGVFIKVQETFGAYLSSAQDSYVCVDCLPLPAFSNAQALKEAGHWLWESMNGHGGTSSHFFYGDHLLACVTPSYTVEGWLVGNGNVQDRWLMEAFVSTRAGQPQLQLPAFDRHRGRQHQAHQLPVGHIGALQAVGPGQARPYLADRGFNGQRWIDHWLHAYAATVISPPPANAPHAWSAADKHWLASKRQVIETVFARLSDVFGIKRLLAHSRWGQYTRIAAKMAAYHLGMFLNLLLGRPPGALATLLS
jgi:hypothetical protein